MEHSERRRPGRQAQSPMETLRQLPALVVLERFPVPVAAIGPDGAILFANSAFATMLGHTTDSVLQIRFQDIFHTQTGGQSIVDVARAHANLVVELAHPDGSTVRARMSNSALVRDDDNVALAVFQDLTERLWLDGS